MNTQDWAANTALVEQLSPLVAEIQVAGSAREPGLMAEAVREGVLAGCCSLTGLLHRERGAQHCSSS